MSQEKNYHKQDRGTLSVKGYVLYYWNIYEHLIEIEWKMSTLIPCSSPDLML